MNLRRSEWRVRADDPKTPFGWWWRVVRVEGGWLLLVMYAWVTAAMFLLPLPWAPAVAMAGFLFYGGIRAFRPKDELAPLLSEPAPQSQFRAEIVYRRGGVILGRDEMALLVVDGWLVGEGVRSHFAIRPSDVGRAHRIIGQGHTIPLISGDAISLLGLDERAICILKAWREFEVSPPGEATFPPAQAHMSEILRWGAWSMAGLMLTTLPNLMATLLRLGNGYAEVKITVSVIGFGLFLWSGRQVDRLVKVSVEARRQEALSGHDTALTDAVSHHRDEERASSKA